MAYTIDQIKDYIQRMYTANGAHNYAQYAQDMRNDGFTDMDSIYHAVGGNMGFMQNLNQALGQYDMAQPGYQENAQFGTNLRDSAGMHSINQLVTNPAAQTTFGNAINNEAGPGWGSTWNNAMNYAINQGKQSVTPPAATNLTTTQPATTPTTQPGQNLGNLYPPRQNWGNYQTSNRGGRYFSPTTGNYQGLQGIYGQQQ